MFSAGVIPEVGVGVWPPNFWPTPFFPRDFHTPNVITLAEKQNRSIYCTMSFNIFSVKFASLYTTSLVLEYSRPHVFECSRS